MLYKQIIELFEILDDSKADGAAVERYLRSIKEDADVQVYPLYGDKGKTDVVKICVHGSDGKRNGGSAPTLGVIGRLGGLGARPERIGFVSDGGSLRMSETVILYILHLFLMKIETGYMYIIR